jgi:hypothetical protein
VFSSILQDMRGVAILVLGALLCAVSGCNSEATVCPNPAACDQTGGDAAPDAADAGSDSGSDSGNDAGNDTGSDVTPDAAAETG